MNKPNISHLKNSKDPSIINIKNSMFAGHEKKFTEEEKQFRSIEHLREKLNSSNKKFINNNYGREKQDCSKTNFHCSEGIKTYKTVGQICSISSINPQFGGFLFKLIRESRPNNCLELGACLGLSAAYISSGLKMNSNGNLITIEGDEFLASQARQNLAGLRLNDIVDVKQGRFQDILPGILKNNPPFDFVFIDGHHDEKATIGYIKLLDDHLSKEAIIVLDDIRWSKGMKKAWDKISIDKKNKFSIDFFSFGILVRGGGVTKNYKIAL